MPQYLVLYRFTDKGREHMRRCTALRSSVS